MKRLMIYSKRKLPDITGGKDLIKKNGVIIFLGVMFLCGLITGISLYFGAERERELITLFAERFVARRALPFFLTELVINGVPMLVAMLGGVSAAGLPFIAAVPFVKGLFHGVLSAYLITEFSAKGYGFYSLITVPGGAIGVFSVLCLCEMCFSLSGKVFRTAFADSRESINGAHVLVVYGMCMIGAVLGCTVDMIMKLIFGGIFRL